MKKPSFNDIIVYYIIISLHNMHTVVHTTLQHNIIIYTLLYITVFILFFFNTIEIFKYYNIVEYRVLTVN